MSHKWRVFKAAALWIAEQSHRRFEAATWEEAIQYATDDHRDEI